MSDQTIQPAGLFRVFLDDGTQTDVFVAQPWPMFVSEYIKHGLIVTGSALIERASVSRILKLYQQGDPVPQVENVIPFPDPKGNA